jgi:hypothetical protein
MAIWLHTSTLSTWGLWVPTLRKVILFILSGAMKEDAEVDAESTNPNRRSRIANLNKKRLSQKHHSSERSRRDSPEDTKRREARHREAAAESGNIENELFYQVPETLRPPNRGMHITCATLCLRSDKNVLSLLGFDLKSVTQFVKRV